MFEKVYVEFLPFNDGITTSTCITIKLTYIVFCLVNKKLNNLKVKGFSTFVNNASTSFVFYLLQGIKLHCKAAKKQNNPRYSPHVLGSVVA